MISLFIESQIAGIEAEESLRQLQQHFQQLSAAAERERDLCLAARYDLLAMDLEKVIYNSRCRFDKDYSSTSKI